MGGRVVHIKGTFWLSFLFSSLFLKHSLLLPFNTLNPVLVRKTFRAHLFSRWLVRSFLLLSLVGYSTPAIQTSLVIHSSYCYLLLFYPIYGVRSVFPGGLSFLSLSLPLFRKCFRPLVGTPSTKTSPSSFVYDLIRILFPCCCQSRSSWILSSAIPCSVANSLISTGSCS